MTCECGMMPKRNWPKGKKSMPTNEKTLRVLIVDDNRDGADALGLLIEELGNQVHVTYGGTKALEVADRISARSDARRFGQCLTWMVVGLVMRFRQIPAFAQTRIVAITGQKDEEHKSSAMKAGFDAVLFKPVALTEIKAVIGQCRRSRMRANRRNGPKSVRRSEQSDVCRLTKLDESGTSANRKPLLKQKAKQQSVMGSFAFKRNIMGWRSEQIHAHFIKDLLVVRIHGVLTLAERQLGKSLSPEKGRDLIKQVRKQLLELARPMLESLVHEVAGVKVREYAP